MEHALASKPHQGRWHIVLGVALALFASFATWLASGDALFCGDIGVKYVQMQALASGQRAIENPVRELDPEGELFPLKAPFVIQSEGRFYSVYLNPYVWFGSLAYRWGGPTLCRALTLACALGAVGATYLLARRLRLDPRAALGAAALLLFATPFWLYGCCFWEHAPATLLSTAAFALLCAQSSARRVLLAGACFGLAATLRPEALLMPCALALAIALRRSEQRFRAPALLLLSSAATALLVLLLAQGELFLAHAQQYLFPHLQQEQGGRGNFATPGRWSIARGLLGGSLGSAPGKIPEVLVLALLIVSALVALLAMARSELARKAQLFLVPLALLLASVSLVTAILEPNVYLRGLLVSCPLVLLALPALPSFVRSRGAALVDRDTSALTFFFFCAAAIALAPNDGGTAWGPRFLLPAFPLLACLCCATRERAELAPGPSRPVIPRLVAALAIVLGLAVQLVGMRNVAAVRTQKSELLSTLAARTEPWVLTSWSFLPQAAALPWTRGEKRIGVLDSPAALQRSVEALYRRGVASFLYVNVESGTAAMRRFGPYVETEPRTVRTHLFDVRVSTFRLDQSWR
ncbi:MAG: hypothetical protein JNM84_10160 [Planctomycetes bacterium]|nr:hypothetical protein [Planctomycetota bacterium]